MDIKRVGQVLTLELSRDEAQAIWGGALEGAHAVGDGEFEIRVGQPRQLALDLMRQLKPVLSEWDDKVGTSMR